MFAFVTRPLGNFNRWVAGKAVGLKTKVFNWVVGCAGFALTALQMFDMIDVRQYIVDVRISGPIMLGIAMANYWLRKVTEIEHERQVAELRAQLQKPTT